jgi:hypothetical protein
MHFFSTSAGLIDLVVFISAFMGWTSSSKMHEAPPGGSAAGRANAEGRRESQAKAGLC